MNWSKIFKTIKDHIFRLNFVLKINIFLKMQYYRTNPKIIF